jgi:hypothetical protein
LTLTWFQAFAFKRFQLVCRYAVAQPDFTVVAVEGRPLTIHLAGTSIHVLFKPGTQLFYLSPPMSNHVDISVKPASRALVE